MTKSLSMVCALVTTFIWGTAFIAQDTGMDNIGPLTFNSARFIVGFFTILPLALLFERKKIKLEILNIKSDRVRVIIAGSITHENLTEVHNLIGGVEYHGRRIVDIS